MAYEEMIDKILSASPKVSKSEILEKLEKAKRRSGELISDATLLRMIGAELGVELPYVNATEPTLLLDNLIPSLHNVTATGRVIAVFPPRTFTGRKNGKFASVLVADKSGFVRVVLWNHQADLIELNAVKSGQIIRFSHLYTKEDAGGKIELHTGNKSEVEINPSCVQPNDYPTINQFLVKIAAISYQGKNMKVNTSGAVGRLSPVSTFERQDLSQGKVMRFSIVDEVDEIPVVAWNEKADELEKTLSRGVKLCVVCARVKKAMNEGLELHIDGGTYVETVVSEEKPLRIADLKEGMNHVNLLAEVATKPVVKEVRTARDEHVKLASFELKDETGRIWFSAWRKHVEAVCVLRVSDRVRIENAYVKRGFGDQPEISTSDRSCIVNLSVDRS